MTIESLLASKEIVVTCGSGGVGKTTTAAATAAMAAVRHGGKVLVVTVDPARRLASALGLKGFGNEARRVPARAFSDIGVKPRGEMWAAMLDTKQSWDALVRRHAPDETTKRRILENPLYQNISGRFVQSHDYIAMERLYELHSEGTYDLIIVDTPPTRNAVDFIEAPERMAEFFQSRLLKMLIVPYRSRLVNMASRPFYQIADRILGSQFLADIAEFFILFQTMYSGFVTRANAVERLLHDRRTTFMVVSTLEAAAFREAEFFIDVLSSKKFHLGALVLNKVLPAYLLDSDADQRAEQLVRRAGPIASGEDTTPDGSELAELVGSDPDQVERVLAEIGHNFVNFSLVARREAEQRNELAKVPDVVATAPELDADIADLAGLLRLGEQIWN
ncbi:MAG: AAA family ATPase [Actinomycetota bacterium]|nr:AAA family ATPase [Actinomycetota bacterium]